MEDVDIVLLSDQSDWNAPHELSVQLSDCVLCNVIVINIEVTFAVFLGSACSSNV